MANEFFRAQPGQGYAATAAPYTPDAQDLTPGFETRLPQFGIPLPAMPAIPSAGSIPTVAPDMSGPPAGATELSPSCLGLQQQWLCLQVRRFRKQECLQNDPRSATAGLPVSPFAMPMPEFGARIPSFKTGLPAIPPLPPVPDSGRCKISLDDSVSVLLLANAGGLNGSGVAPVLSPPAAASTLQYDPRSAAAVSVLSVLGSDAGVRSSLFPSFEQECPSWPLCRRYSTKTMLRLC